MLNARIMADLAASGLTPEDVTARALSNAERAATGLTPGIEGYVIPYYDLAGKPVPFYRVKAFDHNPKYKQVKASPNHIYFPANVRDLIIEKGYVIITEGEKKAAKATKEGFPTIALGGVDSWRNRTLVLPEGLKYKNVPGQPAVSIKIDDEDIDIDETSLAKGLQNVIDLFIDKHFFVIICFDNDDNGFMTKFDVQRAAATLAFELRFKGIETARIKQMFLPQDTQSPDKLGVDDYIMQQGSAKFQKVVEECIAKKNCFPRHPNIQEFVQKRLARTRAIRKEQQQTAMAIVADMDARGSRLLNKNTDEMYFFENKTRTLMAATLRQQSNDILQNTKFTRYLFQTYGIGPADKNVLGWLATFFTTEAPIGIVSPQRVCCVRGDFFYQQLNDGQYIVVTNSLETPYEIKNNGDDGILFEASKGVPMDADEVIKECYKQTNAPLKPFWMDVLKETRLRYKGNNETLIGLLFYLSPWIQRWRGTQLPIEMMIGEPGSGKSSLYELRLSILLGEPKLRNAPRDMRDWYASVSSTGGVHVIDNLHMLDKQLRQAMSDEYCRLCTEPTPTVEMRKLYSNNELVNTPVTATFGVTAVQQPFHNSDIMQRSIVIEFDKGESEAVYESQWADHRIQKFGGRAKWIAHHMVVLHHFLLQVKSRWNVSYRAKHRLINFEQSLMLMANVFELDSKWIPAHLSESTESYVQAADWAFAGLCDFADAFSKENDKSRRITTGEIAQWAQGETEYAECHQLTNSRMLGKYMSSHKQMLAVIAGIKYFGKVANRDWYIVDKEKKPKVVNPDALSTERSKESAKHN